jgi:hypothetical protein
MAGRGAKRLFALQTNSSSAAVCQFLLLLLPRLFLVPRTTPKVLSRLCRLRFVVCLVLIGFLGADFALLKSLGATKDNPWRQALVHRVWGVLPDTAIVTSLPKVHL